MAVDLVAASDERAKQAFFVQPLSLLTSIMRDSDSTSVFELTTFKSSSRRASSSQMRPMANAQFMPLPALSLPSDVISLVNILCAMWWARIRAQPASSIGIVCMYRPDHILGIFINIMHTILRHMRHLIMVDL